MAVPKQRHMTADEFEQFTAQSENAERRWEFIDGEVIGVPSNPYSSQIAALIIAALMTFVRPRGLGHVTGEGAGYIIAGQKLSPDIAFVSKSRQATIPYNVHYNPIAPDLMVEVLSPTNKPEDMEKKSKACAVANVLLWIVNPESRSVKIYTPGQPITEFGILGVLKDRDVLPGFKLRVSDIFPIL